MLGRNAPCPCGSGRKYKQCCLRLRTERAGETSAEIAAAACRLGTELLASNRNEQAVACFQRALAINPTLVVAHNNLGIALKELGRLDEAIAGYKQALRIDPRYAPAHHNLGEVLYRQGSTAQARTCFESALAIDANFSPARFNLANIMSECGESDGAIGLYRELMAANWNPAGVCMSLGVALRRMARFDDSLHWFLRAKTIAPTLPEAHFNLALAYVEMGEFRLAIDSIHRVLEIRASFNEALLLLGVALGCQGKYDEAVARFQEGLSRGEKLGECYANLGSRLLGLRQHLHALHCFQQCLATEPNQPVAQHFVAALQGITPEHSAREYVEQLFDGAAEQFDRQLVRELGYTVPRDLARLATEFARGPSPWDVLDLGCGTGLLGVELASQTRRLVGVDLSSRMLDRARLRGVYGRLEQADLLAAMHDEPAASYDVIAAADVFIYVGKIDAVVDRARELLRPRGLFTFSIEAPERETLPESAAASAAGYLLSATGRYAHRTAYLEEQARRVGFQIECMKKATLRFEHQRPVAGWLVVWRA